MAPAHPATERNESGNWRQLKKALVNANTFLLMQLSSQKGLFQKVLPGEPLAQAAQGVLESPFLEVFNKRIDVALWDRV